MDSAQIELVRALLGKNMSSDDARALQEVAHAQATEKFRNSALQAGTEPLKNKQIKRQKEAAHEDALARGQRYANLPSVRARKKIKGK